MVKIASMWCESDRNNGVHDDVVVSRLLSSIMAHLYAAPSIGSPNIVAIRLRCETCHTSISPRDLEHWPLLLAGVVHTDFVVSCSSKEHITRGRRKPC
jgi:hypothetical protein